MENLLKEKSNFAAITFNFQSQWHTKRPQYSVCGGLSVWNLIFKSLKQGPFWHAFILMLLLVMVDIQYCFNAEWLIRILNKKHAFSAAWIIEPPNNYVSNYQRYLLMLLSFQIINKNKLRGLKKIFFCLVITP